MAGGPGEERGRDARPQRAAELAAAALQRAAAVLGALSTTELEDLVAGRAELVVQPTGGATRPPAPAGRGRSNPAPAVDVAAVVETINGLPTPGDVAHYLESQDDRFTVPVLKQIARALGPTVAATARSKAELRRNIVAGTAGFRQRSAAMSGGRAWS
ncbi:MAG TPA: hypothetical protein VD813_15255 [Pseudonocardia sp.]|nr:hypothetical protein [Pseudonocardia sp.]